ncbi:unnamed protein product [Porites evermanni]|uniref:UPAR/Ly6 domain-containing protein n=1 Tax=Porites evermanni TaxID=104178 RepID=A0ABN8PP76_9CNID|nr:unnamed protein product [Porites evermanni]
MILTCTGDPATCNHCLENDLATCDSNQQQISCSNDTFPNLGTTHCYTAAARYLEGGNISSGVARGCGNCTGNTGLQFKTAFDQFFSNETVDLSSFDIQCCQANGCNNQSVVPLPSPTVAPSASTNPTVKLTSSTNITPSSHACRFYPFTGILASVFIALNVSLKNL